MKSKLNRTYKSLAVFSMLLTVANRGATDSAGVSAISATGPTTRLVSVNLSGGTSTTGNSFPIVISASGRFVAFETFASDIVTNDTNGAQDVFVRDVRAGTTELVSINSLGTASGNGNSYVTAITPNGRFVVFVSTASDLVTNDTNNSQDIFVRDLKNGVTTLVSVNSAGTSSGNDQSFGIPKISDDGRFVAFGSVASDLVANDTNATGDVFVRDLKTGTTVLASINSTESDSGNGDSAFPVLSADGRTVAFRSTANDLVANDNNISDDVFVRDLNSGTTILASVNSRGISGGNANSGDPVLSANGRFVAFDSEASDLVANDTNGVSDVFVHEIATGITTLVSINSSGTNGGNRRSDGPVLSANGRFIAFSSTAHNLTANDNNDINDAFVRDLKTGITTLVSINPAGTASSNGNIAHLRMSANGRFVAFDSDASNLVANDRNGKGDAFVRDLKARKTILASINRFGTNSGNETSSDPILSANGRFVTFYSQSSNLVANDTNGIGDAFIRPVR